MRQSVRRVGVFYSSMPRRYIDFVLAWETPSSNSSSLDPSKKDEEAAKIVEKRRIFERNLAEEGLHLERETLEGSNLNFVKIHSSMAVLRRYTEILRLRMPMKEMDADAPGISTFHAEINQPKTLRQSRLRKWLRKQFNYDECKFPPSNQRLHAIYSRDKEYLFDVDENEFFTPSIRSNVTDFIIRRKRYSDNSQDDFAFGIERLINDKVYCAAYPLHDGDLKSPGTQRHLLYTEWASLRNCLKSQPLDHIKEYFGVNIGLYFAWLGFYTRMLIPASILGFFCFIYGIGTLGNDEYSKKVCADNRTMCRLCSNEEVCQNWRLDSTCDFAKFTYVFDNNATVFFAVIMSFWAAIFLEFWKRYSAQITHKWDLSSLDITEEQPRLEYLSRLKRLKKLETDVVNPNTEPHVSFWKTRVPFQLMSLSTVLFLVTLAMAVIVGVIAYRLFMLPILKEHYPELQSKSLMIISASAAGINLIVIFIFNLLYTGVAQYLTELELHRTQTEFDDSLTLKIFVLQFVNYYSSIFYIAFFKGRFVTSPNEKSNFLSQDRCGTAGCMTELCIQLAIIMVGKQFMGGILEMTTPVVRVWVNHLTIFVRSKRHRTRRPAFHTQWSKDYKLSPWNSRSLFNEYLEMIIQYGFVTIFVAAFPLAPLFALLNNVLEMRLDATKMLIYNRRPVSQRVKNIGVWYGILDMISRIAVISNALIIAFTSNFIPKLMYYAMKHGSSIHFFEHSLVSFNSSHFYDASNRNNSNENNSVDSMFDDPEDTVRSLSPTDESEAGMEMICWYQAYAYNHTWGPGLRYARTRFYWKVFAARLIFVLIFQNIVSVCVLILKVLIPDVPKKLENRIRHENHLTSEIIIKQEMIRARDDSGSKKKSRKTSNLYPNPYTQESAPHIYVHQNEREKTSPSEPGRVSANEEPGSGPTEDENELCTIRIRRGTSGLNDSSSSCEENECPV